MASINFIQQVLKVIQTRTELSEYLASNSTVQQKIGLVPTMGALHAGHISLVEIAKKQSEIVVCSIFVNPTQFNDPKDLEKYPRPIAKDIVLLENAGCDVLFMPEVSEMYSPGEKWHIDLGGLDEILEGKIRPGHYQGVTQIVHKLFDLVKPDLAFFGQKDYQQFMVIKHMVHLLELKIKLVMCPIIRESDGLAMSSRNIHLNTEERKNALALYQALMQIKANFEQKSIAELQKEGIAQLQQSPGIDLEYLEICDGQTLKPTTDKSETLVALVAARLGQTRLIDNILLK